MSNEKIMLCVCGSDPELMMESFDREDSLCYECRGCGRSGGKAIITEVALNQWNMMQRVLRCVYYDALVKALEAIKSETRPMGIEWGDSAVHKLASGALALAQEGRKTKAKVSE